MARRRDLVTVLDEHERDIRRLRATLARVAATSDFLPLTGGTMTGDLNMGGNHIENVDNILGDNFFAIQSPAGASRFFVNSSTGDMVFYHADGTSNSLQWDESDLLWKFADDVLIGTSISHATPVFLEVEGATGSKASILVPTPTGGDSWIGYSNGNHYLTFDVGDAIYFREYDVSGPTYTTLVDVKRERTVFNHGIKIDSALDQTYEDGQIRLTYSGNSKSFLVRRDNSTLYFLISDTEDGAWNATRPFGIHQDGFISHIGKINANVEPNSNKAFNLGSSSLRWNTIYGSVISLDNEIQLPTGGSVSDPSLTWDSDTGLWSPADGDLRVTCNNSQVWYWTNSETRAYNHFDPGGDNSYDLGDASLSWRRLYVYDIYDNDGVRRMDLDSSGWFNFMSDVGNTRFQVGNDTVIFNDEIQGTSAMTPTGSTAYKSIVHNATSYQFYRYTSKRAIKENIRHLPKAVSAKLYDLTPRFFDMKEANRTGDEWADFDQPGFIADEVWDVFGDVAAPPDENGEPSGWTERYMIPLMVSELQDHEAENIKQQGQINNLRERVRVLEALVETMMEAQT